MFNKFKFIPLILIFVSSLFSLEIYSTVPYDYRLRITGAGDMWLYNGIVRDVVHYCQYTQVENNPYYVARFNETSFKEKSFYSYKDPHTVGFIAYNAGLIDPGSLFRFMGYDKKPCSTGSSATCNFLKYETYDHATIPGTASVNCVSCDTSKGEYFDSTTGLCVNKCEDITNQNDRLDCMCKRSGKIGYNGSFSTMNIGGDGSMVCSYGCKSTKDDPEARPNGDGTMFNVSYDIKDTDPNANGVCFTDDIYAPNASPGPNPKPDDPGNNNGTKPGGDNPKPDDPGNNNGTKPGGGGGKPGDPGNNNGTNPGGKPNNPGNNNGTKPGDDDKNNPDMDFSGYDKLTKDVEKGMGQVMDMYDDAKKQLKDLYDKIKNGSLSDFKPSGFVASCPYTRDFVIKDGLSKKITIDICAVVKDARSVLYFIFYAIFSTIFSILLFKIIIRLV